MVVTTECDASGLSKKPKRRQVSLSTFTKCQAQLEKEHQTMAWLCCDTDKSNPLFADTLWCHACRTNEAEIIGRKNYSSAWISGSTNYKSSCGVDHANSDQHKAAMNHKESIWYAYHRILSCCKRPPQHGQGSTGPHQQKTLISAMLWVKDAWLLQSTLFSMNWK